ncbi:FMN-binding protein [Kitasatospora sp. NBC_00240]|uniref:FMN-binding protein n=1 Tax=Kitasatospora sp. NBC_00240 TaxID=2903567 RepID=UPI00224EAEF8|nr:FMN-binding protein [Kitasatospora sp. NBC_00240]MCX5210384.1 FMN-binding protein [Kitasatospora sp. NBC_00240]
MRRAVVASSATVAGIVLLLSLKPHEAATTPAAIGTDTGTGAGAGTGTGSGTGAEADAASPSAGTGAAAGTVRTVTGTAANTRFGPVQVKVTLDGTKITKVEAIQYPTQDRRDQEINSYAVPLLDQEAVDAQSADIDVVSGATFTSQGYTTSLQSALDQAAGR